MSQPQFAKRIPFYSNNNKVGIATKKHKLRPQALSVQMSNVSWRRRRRFFNFFLQLRIYPLFRLLPVLWLLLCYCCCCCCAEHRRHAVEHSVKLSNCYDIRYGFDGVLTGSVPKLLFPAANSSNSGNSSTITNANMSTTVSDLWTQHQLQLKNGSDVDALGFRPGPAIHTGWQCCCWNATNQVSNEAGLLLLHKYVHIHRSNFVKAVHSKKNTS